jgi:hypothetical protein
VYVPIKQVARRIAVPLNELTEQRESLRPASRDDQAAITSGKRDAVVRQRRT